MSIAAGARLADAWVRAIVAGDEDAALAVLDPACDFRALTPGGEWQASTAGDAAAIVFGRWFALPRRIESIEHVEHRTIAGRDHASYRFRATTPDGEFLVEQQAYFDVADDRIAWIRILCAGFRPVAVMPDT